MNKYLLIIWDDVEPGIIGPYKNEGVRNKTARNFRKINGPDHGIYQLDVVGTPSIEAYSNEFFEE